MASTKKAASATGCRKSHLSIFLSLVFLGLDVMTGKIRHAACHLLDVKDFCPVFVSFAFSFLHLRLDVDQKATPGLFQRQQQSHLKALRCLH